jgi:hypothetical protein
VRTFALALFAAATIHASLGLTEDAPRVILARTSGSALLLWNASPVVAEIARGHLTHTAADDRLERDALRAIASELTMLPAATTITLRILYDRIGDVSPIYGSATFAGVERYATVELDGRRARSDAGRWRELRTRDPIPLWIRYRVIGTLPGR